MKFVSFVAMAVVSAGLCRGTTLEAEAQQHLGEDIQKYTPKSSGIDRCLGLLMPSVNISSVSISRQLSYLSTITADNFDENKRNFAGNFTALVGGGLCNGDATYGSFAQMLVNQRLLSQGTHKFMNCSYVV